MAQVETAMSIAEFKCPKTHNTVVFLCDQSSRHCVYVDNAIDYLAIS